MSVLEYVLERTTSLFRVSGQAAVTVEFEALVAWTPHQIGHLIALFNEQSDAAPAYSRPSIDVLGRYLSPRWRVRTVGRTLLTTSLSSTPTHVATLGLITQARDVLAHGDDCSITPACNSKVPGFAGIVLHVQIGTPIARSGGRDVRCGHEVCQKSLSRTVPIGGTSPVACSQRVIHSYLMLLLASDSIWSSRNDCITCRTFWASKRQRQQRIGSDRQRWEIMLKRNPIQANEKLKSGCVLEHLWHK
jgi:hypothetical protein